jgi:hypothetical protein
MFMSGQCNRTVTIHKRATTVKYACIGLMVFLCCTGNIPAEEVDRLLVAVNGTVITQGDLYIARSLDALLATDKEDTFVADRKEIDRLIDLELIRQELRNLRIDMNDDGSIDARVLTLRERYANDGGLSRVLEQFGISESELDAFLKLELSILKFVEFRFRPFVRVRSNDIRSYYNDRLTPQLQDSGSEIPPLEEVSKKIEEILIEEKINNELDQWIENTRRNARIEYFDRESSDESVSGYNPESSTGQRGTMP